FPPYDFVTCRPLRPRRGIIMGKERRAPMTRLFLLEDDEALAEALAWALEKNDFAVTRAATLAEARKLLAQMGLARPRWPAWGWAALGAGLAVGTLVSWGLCALLRALAPGYFYDMPMFALSPIALVF